MPERPFYTTPIAATDDARRPAAGRTAFAVGVSTFALSFLVRVMNVGEAFRAGVPQIPPVDDLYHAKRILYSAAHFPGVLDFDPDRGVRGAFCPWPPLYDAFAGLLGRFAGGRDPNAILSAVVWLPPLVFSIFAGLLAGAVTRRAGRLAGLVAAVGLALASSPLAVSRLCSIDHHFLEPPLLFGILLGLVAVARLPKEADTLDIARAGALLGAALSVALFVQTAFLLAAALVFVAVFWLLGDRVVALVAGGVGFALPLVAILLYRVSRATGYPDDEWFLGYPHAAALAGALASCAVAAILHRRGLSRGTASLTGLAAGVLAALAVPHAPESFLRGARFFGGDPWLSTIGEFRPLFLSWHTFFRDASALDASALFLVPFVVSAVRRRRRAGLTLAMFAAVYFAASLSSRRFLVTATPLLVTAAALTIGEIPAGRRRAAAALLAAGPTLVLAASSLRNPEPIVAPSAIPMIRAARFLRSIGRPGRVLCGWSWGHLFDVVGGHPVVVDNFGAALGRESFNEAVGLTLSREEDAEAYCRRHDVRFLVLENPVLGITSTARILGLPLSRYIARTPQGEAPSPLFASTFWWKAYYAGRVERFAGLPPAQAPTRFHLVYRNDEDNTVISAPYSGPILEIWELEDQEAARPLERVR